MTSGYTTDFRRLRRARRLRLILALYFGLIEPDDVNF